MGFTWARQALPPVPKPLPPSSPDLNLIFHIKGVVSFSSAFWIPQRNPRTGSWPIFSLSFSSLYSVMNTLPFWLGLGTAPGSLLALQGLRLHPSECMLSQGLRWSWFPLEWHTNLPVSSSMWKTSKGSQSEEHSPSLQPSVHSFMMQHPLLLVSDIPAPLLLPLRPATLVPFGTASSPGPLLIPLLPAALIPFSILSLWGTAQTPPPPWRLNLATSPIPSDRLPTRWSGPPET